MRTFAWFYGPALLLVALTAFAEAQSRVGSRPTPMVATATPLVRVTTQNPHEIQLGKPATFVIGVANEGKTTATGIIVATSIPEHVELSQLDPKPIDIDGRIYKFRIGDLDPGRTKRVTLVAIPRSIEPVRLDTTVIFATSTRSSVPVRRPLLKLTALAPPQALVGDRVDWTVRVTNTGDGLAENVLLTPSIVEGEIDGKSMRQPVTVGNLKPGETKEFRFAVAGSKRGKVKARFVGTNSDGLEATAESSLQVMQAELALQTKGPQVQPMGREGVYEIRVRNAGDAATGSTLVTVKLPSGLEVTSAPENAYHDATRTLRWRITTVRPSQTVPLRFRAETITDGTQTIDVVAQAARIPSGTTTHTTNVISRPNLIVTVMNQQELAAVGEPIRFQVVIVNAGSKSSDDLQVSVAASEGLEAVNAGNYRVADGQIVFPIQKLASGEKTTLAFAMMGRKEGDHRVRVLLDSVALTSELAIEGSAFCYAEPEASAERTAEGNGRGTLPFVTTQSPQP